MSTEQERAKWRVFWDEIPGWAKAAIVGLGSFGAFSAGGYAGGANSVAEINAKIRDLELSKVKMETKLDNVGDQLDRIERKLDRLGVGSTSRRRAEIEG
jgi:hypothetical protein